MLQPIVAQDRDFHRPRSARASPPEGAGFGHGLEGDEGMPQTTYVVSAFEKPHWRTVLTTEDKAKALAMAMEIGDKVRVETVTPG
jgi:hypothetical protein